MTGANLHYFPGAGLRRAGMSVILALALLLAAGCDSFGSASEADYLDRAEQHMDAGDYSSAIIEYRNALRLEDRTGTRAALGRAYLADGQYSGAVSHLERAFRQDSSEALMLPLARTYFQLDRLPDILELPTPGELSQRDAAEFLSYRALAHIQQGQMEEALERLDKAREQAPDLALVHLAEARIAFREGNADAARASAQRATDTDPALAPAWTLIGDVARWEGDVEGALSGYDRALDLRPAQIADRLKRGLTLLELERFDDASRDAEFLREGAPGHPGGHFLQGLVHFQQERFDAAQPYLEEALSAHRNYRPAMPYLAAVHLENGNFGQAEHQLQRHGALGEGTAMTYRLWARLHMEQDNPAAARNRLEDALERHPELIPSLGSMLAALYLDSEQPDRGVEFLRTSLEQGQDSPEMRRMLARALLERGDDAEARELLEADPESDREARALDHLGQGRYSDALRIAEEMISEDPGMAQGYNIQGAALLGLERIDEARLAFQEGLQAAPDSVSLAMNLGSLELRLGNQRAAREVFEDLQEAVPGHSASAMRLAGMAIAGGDDETARGWLEGAIRHHPDQVQPHLMLARLHMSQDRPEDVISTLEAALERHPDEPEVLFAMADVRERLGQSAEALPPLQRLVELRPENVDFRFRLARVLAATGNGAGSIEALRGVLEQDAEHAAARQALVHQLALADRTEEAREALEPLLQADGERADVIARDAWLLAREGNHAAAAARYTEALERQSTRQWVIERHQARMRGDMAEESLQELEAWLTDHPEDLGARHLVGSTQVTLGANDAARETYRTVLAQRENDVVAMNNLAWLLREDATDEALEYARRAADLAPTDPAVLDTLGVVLLYSGDPDGARDVLEGAYADASSTPGIGYNLARARHAAGDSEGARELLQSVLADGGAFPERDEAQSLLDELG
ncbi:XrtA/PEP-CTERM system TPR-repeat protein PrsT [Thioalkalivibrio sp. ALJ1]|uniref:XrtA/PEP-CTERM system TPR-repeat protein PrsT n=1 Tax=Thioalkalivibrio sp. ALJ1 TaxID=1158144 RepID=UPI00056E991F|nr:XrtA/PEP-CTERM system TPR-repeat protein PrsT [Thioalkalivibrio sp. ALJ1]